MNHTLVEVGTWEIKRLRRKQVIKFYPWIATQELQEPNKKPKRVNRDPLALAHYYQSILDSGIVKTRAELSRYLGVSRARVTQVLNRITSKTEQRNGGAE